MSTTLNNVFDAALGCIQIKDPFEKAACTQTLYKRWLADELDQVSCNKAERIINPGRPERPKLVSPRKVPKRSFHSEQGLTRLAHAITHIEFNAINLALDAVYRFRSMPHDYYSDWLRVAAEESSHFLMLEKYLEDHGSGY